MSMRAILQVGLGVLALAAAGCGTGESREATGPVPGKRLTVYSSLPGSGVSAKAADAADAGERLALADAGGRVRGRDVRLVRLSSTAPGDLLWDPDLVSQNASRVADDPTAIAYLGEFDYGASAVSVPITNRQGILQVSPGDGLSSLTRRVPTRPREGPERYYPTDRRTFIRLVPDDAAEVDALVELVREAGARRPAIVSDEQIYGRELAAFMADGLRRAKLPAVAGEEISEDADDAPGVVEKIAEAQPDAILFAGVERPSTAPLIAGLGRRLPRVPLYAAGGLLARSAPLPVAPRRVVAVSPGLPVAALPPAGRRVVRRVARASGPRAARVEALYGYEAMRVVLEAVRRGGPHRDRVVRAALARRPHPFGLALYRLEHGRFRFARVLP